MQLMFTPAVAQGNQQKPDDEVVTISGLVSTSSGAPSSFATANSGSQFSSAASSSSNQPPREFPPIPFPSFTLPKSLQPREVPASQDSEQTQPSIDEFVDNALAPDRGVPVFGSHVAPADFQAAVANSISTRSVPRLPATQPVIAPLRPGFISGLVPAQDVGVDAPLAIDYIYVNENSRLIPKVWPGNMERPKRLVDTRPGVGYASTYKIGLSAVSSYQMNMLLKDLEVVEKDVRDQMDWDSRARKFYLPNEDWQSEERARRPRTQHGGSRNPARSEEDTVMIDPRKPLARSASVSSSAPKKRVRFEDPSDPIEEATSEVEQMDTSDAESAVRRKKPILKKAKKLPDEEVESDDEPARRSMTQCVSKVFSKVAHTPAQDVTNLSFMEYAPGLTFVPLLPTVPGESAATASTKLSLAMQTSNGRDGFNKKGDAITVYDTNVSGDKYIAACAVRNKPGQHRLAMASASENVQKVVDSFHKKLSEKASNILQHMDVANYPQESRALVSESLHHASKSMIGECDFLSTEVCVMVMNFLLQSGKWCKCLCAGRQQQGGRGSTPNRRDTPAIGNRPATKFVFDTARYPGQSVPSGMNDPKLCYPCVNKLFSLGRLKEGENPPANVWFDGWDKFNEHRVSSDCLEPKSNKSKKKK
jgi:hypothetical protein